MKTRKTKKLRMILLILLGLGLGFHAYLMFTNRTFLYKALAATYLSGKTGPDIFDQKWFDTKEIAGSKNPKSFIKHANYGEGIWTDEVLNLMTAYQTEAFLVLYRGELIIEKYFNKNNKDGIKMFANSFSIAKSVFSLMIERARILGYITSLDQPVADFLDMYRDEKRKNITFRHLLDMSSGLEWSESNTDPFSDNARAYYDSDLWSIVKNAKFTRPAGKFFKYQSGSTQIAGMALAKALPIEKYPKGLSDFLEQEFWSPLRMPDPAFWGLDHAQGIEKTYCCLYTTVGNFAHLGQFLLEEIQKKDNQFLTEFYLEKIFQPNTELWDEDREEQNTRYSLGFWHTEHEGLKMTYASGALGQRIIIIPEEELVIVRIGNQKVLPDFVPKKDELDVHFYVYLVQEMLEQMKVKHAGS